MVSGDRMFFWSHSIWASFRDAMSDEYEYIADDHDQRCVAMECRIMVSTSHDVVYKSVDDYSYIWEMKHIDEET